MTYRSIFVHVDDSSDTAQRLEAAARLARRHSAEVLGTYLVSTRELSATESALMPPGVVETHRAASAAAQADAEAGFRAAMEAAGVAKSAWLAPAGDPLEAAVSRSRYADLAILGQPRPRTPETGFLASLASSVILESGRPTLIVPYIGLPRTLGERVLIAWKDSRESARALADAMPILEGAKEVLAIAVTPRAEETVQEYVSDHAVEGFLRRHGIAASVKRQAAPDVSAGDYLLSRAADFGADLIVMGGYSRPRLSRLVWGSVSTTMLESMPVPVLMSH